MFYNLFDSTYQVFSKPSDFARRNTRALVVRHSILYLPTWAVPARSAIIDYYVVYVSLH